MTYYAINDDTLAYIPIWSNPAMIVVVFFAVLSDEKVVDTGNTVFHQVVFVIMANLIYWIPATFVTIKIIERVRKLGIFRKSKAAVP